MKTSKRHFTKIQSNINGTYYKPMICPHCGIGTDGIFKQHATLELTRALAVVVTYKCTDCEHIFLCVYLRNNENPQDSNAVCLYPQAILEQVNPELREISETFVDMYDAAQRAENVGDTRLAAIGYRTALEYLIKDYAIKELKENETEVGKKKLIHCIKDYLDDEGLIKSSDVVRILGNDFTHFIQDYPELDFSVFKCYLDIFMTFFTAKYKIMHPPVFRQE